MQTTFIHKINNLFTKLTTYSLKSGVSCALLGYKDTVVSKVGYTASLWHLRYGEVREMMEIIKRECDECHAWRSMASVKKL